MFEAVQNTTELDWLLSIAREEKIKSYLEIGSAFGGVLWKMAHVMPPGSRVVSVDLPLTVKKVPTRAHLISCISRLQGEGYDAHFFEGDSQNPRIIEGVRSLGPFDLCFIDANHTLPYVTADWEHYGQLARIVAFHDIGWLPRPTPYAKFPIEVPVLWNQLKEQYRHREIKMEPRDNGIGVLWRQ